MILRHKESIVIPELSFYHSPSHLLKAHSHQFLPHEIQKESIRMLLSISQFGRAGLYVIFPEGLSPP